jgi:hypothetical protein
MRGTSLEVIFTPAPCSISCGRMLESLMSTGGTEPLCSAATIRS